MEIDFHHIHTEHEMPKATLIYLIKHPLDFPLYWRAKRQGLSVFVSRSGEVYWTQKANPKQTIILSPVDLARANRRFESLAKSQGHSTHFEA